MNCFYGQGHCSVSFSKRHKSRLSPKVRCTGQGALDKVHWTSSTGRLHWVQECNTVWNWDCNSADAEVWYCDIQGYTAHCTGVIKIKRWRVSAACGCKWLHTGVEPRSEGRTSDTWNTWWGLRLAMMIARDDDDGDSYEGNPKRTMRDEASQQKGCGPSENGRIS